MITGVNGAAFLDRDGTIIRQVELLHELKNMHLLQGAAQAIGLINQARLPVIVITNQPVVARGISTMEDVTNLHESLNVRLARYGAHIDAFYFCPHHPHATNEHYRCDCQCRKPKPGMILQAAADHKINLTASVMIGDTTQDMLAGQNAGVHTLLVQTGHGGHDPWQYACSPEFTATDLLAAAHLWLGKVGL